MAARVINIHKISQETSMGIWRKKKLNEEKCEYCEGTVKEIAKPPHQATEYYIYECNSKQCTARRLQRRLQKRKGASGLSFIRNRKIFPKYPDTSNNDSEDRYRIIGSKYNGDEYQYNVKSLSRDSGDKWENLNAIEDDPHKRKAYCQRQDELKIIRFLLRPRNVIYTNYEKVVFSDEDLTKIFNPMKDKFATVNKKDEGDEWKKKYLELKEKIRSLNSEEDAKQDVPGPSG